jgi:MFS family permease
MIDILKHRDYRRLFSAQILSLAGTGLMTVALALLAYDLSGGNAGIVLGTVLGLKMVAYVGFAPIAAALARRFDLKKYLVALDLARVGLVLFLPFVDQVWQIYCLVFVFQLCSASFTPAFQSVIPDILPDEKSYTRALSLSRLAYDMESLLSPMLAGLLLSFIAFDDLFLATAAGFLCSAAFVLSTNFPASRTAQSAEPFSARLTRGFRIYVNTPRLRGLFFVGLAVSCAGAWVLVNSVVYVREVLGGSDKDFTFVMAAYGFGSMLVAVTLPRLLDRLDPRTPMLAGAFLLGLLPVAILVRPDMTGVLALWLLLGMAMSLALTPGGILLRRSSHSEDRPALYAAQFSLSHSGWLLTYPLAGWLGASAGMETSFLLMGGGALVFGAVACLIWPASDPLELTHTHQALVHDHAHVHDEHHDHEHLGWEGHAPHAHAHRHRQITHSHHFVIDAHHPAWPAR